MNNLISIVVSFAVLVLYPFVAIRRYFEYKYTKPKEAHDMLLVAMAGSVGLMVLYLAFKFWPDVIFWIFGFMACLIYIVWMLVYIKTNYRIRGETPV